MAKTKVNLNKTLYSTFEILEEAKKIYHINTNDADLKMRRKIQRFIKDKNYPNYSKNRKTLIRREDVYDLLYDEKMIKYFGKIGSKNFNYQTNDELLHDEKAELNSLRNNLFDSWEKAGLSQEEGFAIEADKVTDREYLRADELIFLKRKGLTLKSDLSDEEAELIQLYNENLDKFNYQEKHIKEMFNKKKLEIMITALFDKEFVIDEDRLLMDITNYVRCGESSCGNDDPSVRRSYLQLQNPKSYFHKKKKNNPNRA